MSYTEKSDARDYPRKWFFSLGGRIADLIISAIDDEEIWMLYKPNEMKRGKWLRIGQEIRLGLAQDRDTQFSADEYRHNISAEGEREYRRAFDLLHKYQGGLWW